MRNNRVELWVSFVGIVVSCLSSCGLAQEGGDSQDTNSPVNSIHAKPGLYQQLTEPPCSYCVNQDRKQLIDPHDPVVAWIRGPHNGGAAPLRHFLAASRVINDTYGLFFYDPDGGYVSVFEKDYGYEFYGWRGGVMVVRGRDGTVWSALTGIALEGPKKGERLVRVPSLTTEWEHWLLLHPESTAYDLFDGKKYPLAELPTQLSDEARATMGKVDDRLPMETLVIGIEGEQSQLAVSMAGLGERACFLDQVDWRDVAVFWYGPTHTAVVFSANLDGQKLTFYADKISPETAPFKDRETGSRWTLAGRAVDGPLRGKELEWTPSVQCRWYAWSHEYPQTRIHEQSDADTRVDKQ
jgi:hypothetical protein